MAERYRLGGRYYTAEDEADARRQHAEWKASQEAAADAPKEERPLSTALVKNSADYLNSFVNRGQGLGRRAVNLALPKSAEPSWATNEAIKEYDASVKPKTGAGRFGDFSADWALGTLVGAGPELGLAKVGNTLHKALALRRATPAATAAYKGAGALTKGAGRVAANAASGGVQGALIASPDDRGTAATAAALIAATLGTAGEAGRGALRVLGKNRVDPKAAAVLRELQSVDPDAKIPNSHLLRPGFARSIYEGVVSNAPLSGGNMRKQHSDAVQTGYRRLASEITPTNAPLDTIYPKGGSVHDALDNLNFESGSGGAYDRALGKFNQEMFDTSGFQLPQHVQEGLDQLHLPSTVSNDMTGQQLITLRDDLQRVRDQIIAKKAGGDEKLGRQLVKAYDEARDEILDVMKRKFTTTNAQGNPQLSQDMLDYLDDLKKYKEYDTFKSAAKQTSTGEPGFGAVAMAAQRKNPEAGVRGQAGPLQTLGNDFAEVLGDFPSKQGIFQMGASQGITEGVTKAVIPGAGQGGKLVKATALLVNPALGSNWTQKKIAEGFSSARAIEDFLEKYPSFGRFIRSGAISAVREE